VEECNRFNKEIVHQVGKQDYILLRCTVNNTLKGELEFHVFLLKMYSPQVILAVFYQTPTKLVYVCDRCFASLLNTCPHKIRIMFFDFHVRPLRYVTGLSVLHNAYSFCSATHVKILTVQVSAVNHNFQ